jgi:hypothetical protein
MADIITDGIPPEVSLEEEETRVPTWLAQTIGYLRRVSADRAWEDLVKEFVQFETSGHPSGVMFRLHLCSLS